MPTSNQSPKQFGNGVSNFFFRNNFKLIQKLQEYQKEYLYTLYPQSPVAKSLPLLHYHLYTLYV